MEIVFKPIVDFNRVTLEYFRMRDFTFKWRRGFFWNYDYLFLIFSGWCIFLRFKIFGLIKRPFLLFFFLLCSFKFAECLSHPWDYFLPFAWWVSPMQSFLRELPITQRCSCSWALVNSWCVIDNSELCLSHCLELVDYFVLPPLCPDHIAVIHIFLVIHSPPPSLLHYRPHQHPIIPSIHVEFHMSRSPLYYHSIWLINSLVHSRNESISDTDCKFLVIFEYLWILSQLVPSELESKYFREF